MKIYFREMPLARVRVRVRVSARARVCVCVCVYKLHSSGLKQDQAAVRIINL
jgi:hypothetical protein